MMNMAENACLAELTEKILSDQIPFSVFVASLLSMNVKQISYTLGSGSIKYLTKDNVGYEVIGYKVAKQQIAFNVEGAIEAIKDLHSGTLVGYSKFCDQLAEAGCLEYCIKLTDRNIGFQGFGRDHTVIWSRTTAIIKDGKLCAVSKNT